MKDNTQPENSVDRLLADLEEVLTELNEQPENLQLRKRQITLMQSVGGMEDSVLDTWDKVVSLVMLQEDEWIAVLDGITQNAATERLSVDVFISVIEKYLQAEQDYLSLSILLRHLQFLINCYNACHNEQSETKADEDVKEFLTIEETRAMLKAVVKLGHGLLSESQQLWQLWIDWEMGVLETVKGVERNEQIERIHEVYIERFEVPHSTIDQNTSNYSTFCSTYCNHEYEDRLVKATEASQKAKHRWNGESRSGKTREDFELQLIYATDLPSKAQILLEYTKWESNARTKVNNHGRSANADFDLTRAVFERAVVPYAKLAAMVQTSLDDVNKQIKDQSSQKRGKGKGKGKGKKKDDHGDVDYSEQKKVAEETVRAYKDAEASIWASHAAWAEDAIGAEVGSMIRRRAVRAVPHCGSAWSDLLQDMERNDAELDSMNDVFERALALGPLFIPENRTSDMVEVFVTKAAYEARLAAVTVSLGAVHPTLATATRGLESVTKVNKSGDSTLKLEKFLLDWSETRAPEYLDQALLVIDKPNKARSSSYQFTILRAGIEIRRDDQDAAREIFENAIQRTDLDWPEAVYEAFLQFEIIHGTPQSLQQTKKRIEKEQDKLLKRREKAAAEASAYQTQYIAAVGQSAAVAAVQAVEDHHGEMAVEAETTPVGATTASTAPLAHSSAADVNDFKRDREHTTVLISGLPKSITPERLEAFFSEVGLIRESTILPDDDSMHDAALVEFRQVESIPEVLEKDKKKFEGSPINISMLWRSTLYVTNFPRETDDEAIRKLFSQYGRILDTRWPSRKYADSRRFCYITMESPSAAQEALVLHGYKTPGASTDFGLTVLISDPAAKAKRSDASNSTLFVGGLNNKTTENDVRGLFKEYGRISNLKLGWDPVKRICKGFAFVEMSSEAEAKAAVQLHGTQHKGKYLKVELSDPNHANKKLQERNPDKAAEKRLRSVRLSNLPENTQEGLLQQLLEKIVPVKRLELFARTQDAVAELDSQADVGKLLLHPDPFIVNGTQIIITEQGKRPPPSKRTDEVAGDKVKDNRPSQPASGPSTMFAPRAARKALAKPRPTAVAAARTIAATPQAPSQSQDDFRALVASKNKQRESNLVDARDGGNAGEKRKLDDAGEGESKRTKT